MNPIPPHPDEHLLELLVDEALGLLDADEEDALAMARHASPSDLEFEREELGRIVALVDLSFIDEGTPPLPVSVRRGVQEVLSARGTDAADDGPAVAGSIGAPSGGSALSWLVGIPWLVAAAAVLLAVMAWWPTPATPVPSAGELRAELMALPGSLRYEWNDLEGTGIRGDVVWHAERQAGFLTFSGLTPNDPEVFQYQLWIVDPAKGENARNRVDGGVFDVTSTGEVIVPIDPKLGISQAAAFAVTTEPPGGVVVHEAKPPLSRMILLATDPAPASSPQP